MPENPNAVPARIAPTTGLVTTPTAVRPMVAHDSSRCRAHSTETVTSVHSSSELKTTTRDTAGIAASLSSTLASGTPSSTRLAKMPPIANTDCDAPSMRNNANAASRPTTNAMRQPPKYARSNHGSTGGSREKSLNSRKSSAGTATENTNFVSQSDAAAGHPATRISA